ncbi:flagellar basal body-associated FliL family protein [Nisaea acidiphila]|uniref:Flagellar protein FliL n=1 Tax=Nisaea acidiphila TaxID=1862145 RepID=A0A9J7AW35_9PROT|nr:flagellar basal body-associated FliL family protein [Nisaea acidiphila]UUX50484.1 flagellar basal body-associated FliL family protein [Nisaea acidiphila]
MAEEGEVVEDGGEVEEDGSSRKLSPKKIILFVLLPLLLLVGAGAGGALMLGMLGGEEPPPEVEGGEQAAEPEAPQPAAQAIFFEVPDLIVNLNTNSRKTAFLKIKIALEVSDPADVDVVNENLPRIVDNFQVYLRELRVDDLQGSAGMYRLREELLRRVNLAVRPARVKDVLFKEMLVQ